MDGEISPEEVEQAFESDDPPRVVDIRSPAAYEQGHIPGSESVPFGDLPDEVESLSDADHIVTVCPHGKASVQAARLIESYEGTADARIESMAGGLAEWPGELESDDERAGTETDGEGGDTTDGAGEAPDAPF